MQADRRSFLKAGVMAAAASGIPNVAQSSPKKHAYNVGAYYFPGWHSDPRMEEVHGKGWTEWRLLQRAQPRFTGHQQPKVPLWGYEDESVPSVFERKIHAAAENKVGFFIFDWYWYEGKPFLNSALNRGYLQASNNERTKFCLMWANQDWIDLFPTKLHAPKWVRYKGNVDRAQFESLTDYIIQNYFSHRRTSWSTAAHIFRFICFPI